MTMLHKRVVPHNAPSPFVSASHRSLVRKLFAQMRLAGAAVGEPAAGCDHIITDLESSPGLLRNVQNQATVKSRSPRICRRGRTVG